MSDPVASRAVLPPATPSRTPRDRFMAETGELLSLLKQARDLIDAAEHAQWEKPVGDTFEAPDRQIVGSHSDPTGDTVADETRLALRHTTQQLTHDPKRAQHIRHIHKHVDELAHMIRRLNDHQTQTVRRAAIQHDRYHRQGQTYL